MNFKDWFLKESAIDMSPWEAMEVMQLQDLKGKVLDNLTLRNKFFELSKKYHPDRNVGDENAAQMMSKVNNANITLQKYVGKTLPESPESASGSSYSSDFGDFGFTSRKQTRPPNSKTVTEEDVKKWCEEALNQNRRVLFLRDRYTGFGLFTSIGYGPVGVKKTRKTLSENVTPEELFNLIKNQIPDFPNSLIDIGQNKFESYLTFLDDSQGRHYAAVSYRSISIEPKKQAKKKEAGVGMTRDKVMESLQEKGLTLLRKTKDADYFGFYNQPTEESYFIRVKQRKMDLIVINKVDYGYKKVNNDLLLSKEFYFGDVSDKIIDSFIELLKKKLQAKFNYTTGV
jgi:hypothetical protein